MLRNYSICDFSEELANLIKRERYLQDRELKLKQEVRYWMEQWQKATGQKTETEQEVDNEIRLLREQG